MAKLPAYVSEAFDKGECAIGRFWGQTHVYIPSSIADRVGRDRIEQVAIDLFTRKRLEDFCWLYHVADDCHILELPSVLVPGKVKGPEYDKPDQLISLILEHIK